MKGQIGIVRRYRLLPRKANYALPHSVFHCLSLPSRRISPPFTAVLLPHKANYALPHSVRSSVELRPPVISPRSPDPPNLDMIVGSACLSLLALLSALSTLLSHGPPRPVMCMS